MGTGSQVLRTGDHEGGTRHWEPATGNWEPGRSYCKLGSRNWETGNWKNRRGPVSSHFLSTHFQLFIYIYIFRFMPPDSSSPTTLQLPSHLSQEVSSGTRLIAEGYWSHCHAGSTSSSRRRPRLNCGGHSTTQVQCHALFLSVGAGPGWESVFRIRKPEWTSAPLWAEHHQTPLYFLSVSPGHFHTSCLFPFDTSALHVCFPSLLVGFPYTSPHFLSVSLSLLVLFPLNASLLPVCFTNDVTGDSTLWETMW